MGWSSDGRADRRDPVRSAEKALEQLDKYPYSIRANREADRALDRVTRTPSGSEAQAS